MGPGAPVLLHGFSASSAAWGQRIVDGLSPVMGPPALVDLPGHGRRSAAPAASAFTLEAVHRTVANALGPEPAPLMGYSMGGRLALSFAVAHPSRVSCLVLESASPGLATEPERVARRQADEALAAQLTAQGMTWFVDHWERLPLFASRARVAEEERARQRAVREANHPDGLARALRLLGTGALPSYWDALADLPVPTLLLAGALDEKFVGIARAMAQRLPDARLEVVPDTGHTVHLERPDAWLDAVVSFLRG